MKLRIPLFRIFVLFLIGLQVQAQSVLWSDAFESYPGTGSTPTNYNGSMKVYSNHGVQNTKALCAQLSSFHASDSIVSPVIGPLNANSVFRFDYRFVTYIAGAAFNGYTLNSDVLEVYAAQDGAASFGAPLMVIQASNHTSSLDYANRFVSLAAFEGQNIRLKVRCVRGNAADYWLDMDNFEVSEAASVHTTSDIPEFSVFPNPSNEKNVWIQFSEPLSGNRIEVLNMFGTVVMRKTIASQKLELNVEELPRGIYYIKVEGAKKSVVRKLVLR